MRAWVDLEDARVAALDQLAKRLGRSRASVLREAVDEYLRRHGPGEEDEAFGLRGKAATEGPASQTGTGSSVPD